MKKGMIKIDGVSNVVASIMVLGIMTSLLGMIFTTYVPAMAESTQYDHSTQITEDFINFKNQVDVLIVRNDLRVSMATTTTLGDKGGPVMAVGHNSGTLSFYPDDPTSAIFNASDPTEDYARGRGTLVYRSSYDRIADKDLYFEHDAIIIEQEGNSVMKVSPNIFLKKSGSNIVLSYTTTSFAGEAVSLSGTKTVSVTSTLISSQRNTYYYGGSNGIEHVELKLTTKFVDLWVLYFQDLVEAGELTVGDYTITSGADWASLVVNDVYRLTSTSAVIEIGISD
jgi:hypothetical protein